MPPRCASSCRRLDRSGVYPAPSDQPGGHRVGVPHLTGTQLITAPHGRRHLGNQIEQPLCATRVAGQSPRALDGLDDVGDLSAAPAANLIAKDPKPPGQAGPDRTFRDDASPIASGVTDRRLLDHEECLLVSNLEGGVVQSARGPALGQRRRRLEDATVQSDEMATGTERQPVEVDRGSRHAGNDPTAQRTR